MNALLGLVGQPSIQLKKPIEVFLAQAKGKNQNGWGLSGFSKDRAVFFDRQAAAVTTTPERIAPAIERAEKNKTPVLIGQLRDTSALNPELGNVGPFHYRDWVIAHQGPLPGVARLDIGDYQTQGRTESERLLVWFVDQASVVINSTEQILEALKVLNEKVPSPGFNFLMSDGKMLWAYRQGEKLYSLELDGTTVLSSEPLPELGPIWNMLPEKSLVTYTPGKPSPDVMPLTA